MQQCPHRAHAIIEQVIADLKNGPLAHLPSGTFTANAARLVCAAIAFNLSRGTGCLASTFHAKVTTATIRRQLITIPARIATPARRTILHLPTGWPWANPGRPCSTPAADHPARPPPDHPATKARPQDPPRWKSRTDRQTHPARTQPVQPEIQSRHPQKSHRWIQAETRGRLCRRRSRMRAVRPGQEGLPWRRFASSGGAEAGNNYVCAGSVPVGIQGCQSRQRLG